MLPLFEDQPVQGGVGDYHVNRFRVAFRSPQRDPRSLAGDFISRFTRLLSSPAATAEQFGDHIRFHGRIEILGHSFSQPHADWVRIASLTAAQQFTAQTLRRTSPDADDALPAVGGAIVGLRVGTGAAVLLGPVSPTIAATAPGAATAEGASLAVEINRRHFLAGRRAWRLDDATVFTTADHRTPLPPGTLILETAAVERMSALPYLTASPVLEAMVPSIWCHLLENVAGQPDLHVLPPAEWPLEAGWTRQGNVHFVRSSFGQEANMKSSADYVAMRTLYTALCS